MEDGPIIPSMMLARRDALIDVGMIDKTFSLSEDTDLCLRLAEKHLFTHVPAGLVYKRRHDNKASRVLKVFLNDFQRQTSFFVERIRHWPVWHAAMQKSVTVIRDTMKGGRP